MSKAAARSKLIASPTALAALQKIRARLAAPPPAAGKPARPARSATPNGQPKQKQTPSSKPEPPPACPPPDNKPAAPAVTRAQHWAATKDLLAVLCERWPAAFCTPRVPLAIGIHQELLAVLGEEISTKTVSWAMRHWTHRPDYLDALVRGEVRRNLDGSPATAPSEQDRQNAAQWLQVIEAKSRAAFQQAREEHKTRAAAAAQRRLRNAPASAASAPRGGA
jgi:hypothetical protein